MADQRSDRPSKLEPPADIIDNVNRGAARIRELAPSRNECWQFFRNNTYAYRTAENQLVQQATAPSASGRGKPNHRVRTKRPIHMPIIRQEVSYATQRVPTYEINPSNGDPEVQNAAHIAQQVALFGYEAWSVQRATEKVVTHALVADEGFAWPYWDPTIGPSLGFDEESEAELHEGDIKIRTFSSNQVGWEPGVDFEESPWWIVLQALPPQKVKEIPGYLPGDLTPDATDRTVIGTGKPRQNRLVMVTEYLERPCKKYPKGRRVCLANGRQITRMGEYPLSGPKGEVLDEPVLHKLSWLVDPDSDRDMGLMRFLLDTVRSYQDAVNKQIEWKNLMMNPQIFMQPGVEIQLVDEPGAIYKVPRPELIKVREVPNAPPLLSELQDRAKADLGFLSSQNDIPSQVEAARAITVLVERDSNARAAFIRNVASFHGRLMRHCLALVAQHYTEGRLIKINGWKGAERIENFKGADLMNQIDVRVNPGSIEPYTKAFLEQRIMNWAQMGWVTREEAMTAVENGTVEPIVNKIQLDVGRANWIIQRIFNDPESVLQGESEDRMVPDPLTGMMTLQQVPWWMPREFDRVPVYKSEFEDAMKTQRYDLAPPEVKTMLNQVYQGLMFLEAQQAQRAQMMQMQQAEQQGLGNAAQAQTKPMPSLPGMSGPGGQPDPAAGQQ